MLGGPPTGWFSWSVLSWKVPATQKSRYKAIPGGVVCKLDSCHRVPRRVTVSGRVQTLTRVGLRACRAGAERSHRPFPQCGFRSVTQAQEPECRTWRGFGQLRCFWEGQQQCVAGMSTSRVCLDWRRFGSCRCLFFACWLMHRWAVWAG